MIVPFNLNVLQEVHILIFSILLNNVNFIKFVFQIPTHWEHTIFISNPYSLVMGEEGPSFLLLTK